MPVATHADSRRRDETGFAIVMVVIMVVVITVIIGVVASQTMSVGGNSQRGAARTASMEAAEGGVQALQQALHARRSTQADGYSIGAADLAAAAQYGNGSPIADTAASYRNGSGAIQLPVAADGLAATWQVLGSVAPTPQDPYLTVYVRGWRQAPGAATQATQAAVVRARFRPGSLADYQLVSDATIRLDPNVTITGRIHSNGFHDEASELLETNLAARIWSAGSVACSSSAGITPIISTAKGAVELGGASGCSIDERTNQFVSLTSAKESATHLAARCGSGDVHCFQEGGVATTAPARVTLSTGSISVRRASGAVSTISVADGGVAALLFDRDVEVSGTTNARVTIVAWNEGSVGVPAPDVRIVGNVGRAVPTATVGRALGLIAENDVIIDPASCPNSITAAMIAVTGSVTLPQELRSPTLDRAVSASCGGLTLTGSIASHSTVALRWAWGGTGMSAGFESRSYLWDPYLASVPPPYWPLAHEWELVESGEANADCYGPTGIIAGAGSDPRCR